MNAIKWIAAIGLIGAAMLLHTYYISYVVNGTHYLYSWPALQVQHDDFLDRVAKKDMSRDSEYTVWIPSADEVNRMRLAYLHDSGKCRFKGTPRGISEWGKLTAWYDTDNFVCKPAWVAPKRKQVTRGKKGVTYEEALANAKKRLPTQSRYGMVPSYAATARTRPTEKEMARCLWIGILLPGALVMVALALIVSTWTGRKRETKSHADPSVQQPRSATPSTPVAPVAPALPGQQASMGDLLRARFGSGVGQGSATRADPLMIIETLDYVGLEWAVARFLMQGQEHKLGKQTLSTWEGRKIDELEFLTREPGTQEWEGKRRFYFDITAGYARPRE